MDDWLSVLLARAIEPDSLLFIAMAIEGGVNLEPFQQIVNVHWDEGLAVEFLNGSE